MKTSNFRSIYYHYPNIYDSLNYLIKAGYVEKVLEKGVNYYLLTEKGNKLAVLLMDLPEFKGGLGK